jgi:hypothetical protein
MKTFLNTLILSSSMFVVLASGVLGQTESLTNADVLKMHDAGLSSQFIVRKLSLASTRFDTSTAAVIELKKHGLPEEVILAMIERQEAQGLVHATPGFSDSGTPDPPPVDQPVLQKSSKEMIASARTIAFVKSPAQPSRQALEKELMKRPDFRAANLTITRYKDKADLYVEIGYVSLSWITHRYVYRIYDRQSGTVLAAGETTSWGSLAENLARNIAKSLTRIS